jgi:chaperonin GroES
MTKINKWNLLGDRVLIEPADPEEETSQGIIVPVGYQESPPEGVVVAVGNGYDGIKPAVQVGDKVSYGKTAGVKVEIDRRELLMMREQEIFMFQRG